jgi:putative sterol carrier protein
MPVFKDAAEVDAYIGEIFRQATADETLGQKFPNRSITFGEQGPTPNVELFMKADVAHRFWLGKVNIAAALAKGDMRAKGPIPKVLKLVPLAKQLFPRYQEMVEKGSLVAT